ncbi:PAS domain-containing protein [Paucibacter sp. R3-3]|uniref:PAS domain-containing protein n=1 Tax=Roseateles agri TaxID=3098619 RepID=A0ABU5DMN1_9BURK|nr:PAS domain-containing protein [Paucibacter sp. R3-3]MDY0747562.1 PAS domain-containing protein [Paucibacter sp. R3-3]
MDREIASSRNWIDLRSRAAARLAGQEMDLKRASPSEAMRVLFELASSPENAADALALLHELQVHQVELELQGEELRDSRAELEAALARQIELYEVAPVACFTVDAETRLHEMNLGAARLLGSDRDTLLGMSLTRFLTEGSADALLTLLKNVAQGKSRMTCKLDLLGVEQRPLAVQAGATRDPAGDRFLIAFVEVG